ncbi:hypothetical protein GW916_10430 [bacterium]|nr:hypothetical protein [bacterium]
MATLEDIRDQIVNSGIILNKRRHHRLVDAMKLVSSAIDRGSHIFEVAVYSKADVEDLRKIKASFPEAVVGAGSLSQIELMKDSLYAGADFFVSPHSDAAMINFAKEKSVFYVPGGASPNELWQLAQSNPDMQNWYTGKNIAAYQLEDLKSELPQLNLLLTVKADAFEICLEKSDKLKRSGALAVRIDLA